MSTPYLKWRENNISLYEYVYDPISISRMRRLFPSIRKVMAGIMNISSKDVRMRRIAGVVSIYVPADKWEQRRTDIITMNTKRDYSNCLYGILLHAGW